jgi:hypothetical protein
MSSKIFPTSHLFLDQLGDFVKYMAFIFYVWFDVNKLHYNGLFTL